MMAVSAWVYRRRGTLGLAVFLVAWYVLQLCTLQLFGEDVAQWWFYFERPPDMISPGLVLAPLSHEMDTLTHIGGNILFLVIAGGVAEPYIGKKQVFISVIGLGYLGTYMANGTVLIHQLWMVAGASGGILALWAYAGFRMRHRAAEYISDGLTLSCRSVETVSAVFLFIGTPIFLFHEALWVDQLHSGHTIGILLGCLYYRVESYLGPAVRVINDQRHYFR